MKWDQAIRNLRDRILAGENTLGTIVSIEGMIGALPGQELTFVVTNLEPKHVTITCDQIDRMIDRFRVRGPLKARMLIQPYKQSEASKQRSKSVRATERALQKAGLPPCAWRRSL